jgi:hypothetical protein
MVSMRRLVEIWIWSRVEMLKEESSLRNFFVLGLCYGIKMG